MRISNLKYNCCFEKITAGENGPVSVSTVPFFFSDGKVACLKTECPAVETVCDREMTAVAVPGKEDDCCQKYICGMYLNSVAQKIHKVSLSPGPDIDRPYVHIGPFSQFGNCKCVVKILLIIMYA